MRDWEMRANHACGLDLAILAPGRLQLQRQAWGQPPVHWAAPTSGLTLVVRNGTMRAAVVKVLRFAGWTVLEAKGDA